MNHIIFKGVSGSKLFGTNNEYSDTDLKEIYIPNGKDILLDTFTPYNEQTIAGLKDKSSIIETSSYAVNYFLNNLYKGDLRSIEIIFTPKDKILHKTKEWDEIIKNKDLLINPKIPTFVKFAQSTLYKFNSKAERITMLNNVLHVFENNKDHKILFESLDQIKQVDDQKIKFDNKFLFFNNKKFSILNSNNELISYIHKELNQYSDKTLSYKNNIDWRSLGHAARIIDEALEYLETGEIIFPRYNANWLKDIKKEIVPVEQIVDFITDKINDVQSILNSQLYYNSDYIINKENTSELILKFHLDAVNKMNKRNYQLVP